MRARAWLAGHDTLAAVSRAMPPNRSAHDVRRLRPLFAARPQGGSASTINALLIRAVAIYAISGEAGIPDGASGSLGTCHAHPVAAVGGRVSRTVRRCASR